MFRSKPTLALATLFGCLMTNAPAEQFGLFTYEVFGNAISITDYPDTATGAVVIPDTIDNKPVTVIDVGAFNEVVGMTSVVIPSTVTTIGSDAFALCTGLTSVTFTGPSSVTSIGSTAFYGCSALTGITIPNGVTAIEEATFEGCSSLTSLEIPAGVTAIGGRAFVECGGLVSMVIPPGVEIIEDYTFENCDSLVSVSLPEGMTSLGVFAFFDCDALTIIHLPASLTNMGRSSFKDCDQLESVFFKGNAPTMGDTVFDDPAINSELRIYFFNGKSGFSAPLWTPVETQAGYVSVNMGPENPLSPWLISNDLPVDADLESDSNGDGVNLLMAYALNLNPNLNLSGSTPQLVKTPTQMSLSFYGAAPGVTYIVECSTNLATWSTAGVTLSAPNSNQVRTATVNTTGPSCFMRLKVSH